jgi:hypothetical protein
MLVGGVIVLIGVYVGVFLPAPSFPHRTAPLA